MKNNLKIEKQSQNHDIKQLIDAAWKNMAPFWPLKNLIACNPLQGFENQPFKEAINNASIYFEQENLPKEVEEINRQTIKWCQMLFDQGQSTIKMPNRHLGLYQSWLSLAKFDDKLHKNSPNKIKKLTLMPNLAQDSIKYCLNELNLANDEQEQFLTLMLTTLSGWASYVKYLGEWKNDAENFENYQVDYLAIRLVIALLTLENAKDLLLWHKNISPKIKPEILKMEENEKIYQKNLANNLLINSLYHKNKENTRKFDAQLVFCIDVRSEPIRRAIESQGNYETFGFAGFFAIPAKIENEITKESYSSCPVLLKPSISIVEKSSSSKLKKQKEIEGFENLTIAKKLYQSLKYGFTTPFILAEAIGLWSGSWMAFHSLSPKNANKFKQKITNYFNPALKTNPCLENMAFEEKLAYAKASLATMGLTSNFAPIIVFCGHGSSTENNAYASFLDCGACGGNHGGGNAKILAAILNDEKIRKELENHSILIPDETRFFAAKHNTTTDEIEFYEEDSDLEDLKSDLYKVKIINNKWRADKMGCNLSEEKSVDNVEKRSVNWAQTRPEWGLAKNASFIAARRELTKDINLDGRSFLHSYDYKQDQDGSALNLILTAPMVVAQWINSQYLFSTINNVAYGGGSKITQNVVGKIGVMQGNGSDLMHGLALQSVFSTDKDKYHEPLRLTTFVHAPKNLIDKAIEKNEILQKLFKNNWVHVFCLEVEDDKIYHLQEDLTWKKY